MSIGLLDHFQVAAREREQAAQRRQAAHQPEPVELLPAGAVTTAQTRPVAEPGDRLTAAIERLIQALDRKADHVPVPRMALRLDEIAEAIGISRRGIDRERSAGRFPRPDRVVGKVPLWAPTTVADWLQRGAGGRK